MIGCAVLIIGGIISASAYALPMLGAGRGVAGIGSGILSVVVPIYQSEVAPAESRGALMGLTGIMYALGYTLAGFIGYACAHMSAASSFATLAW